MSGRYRMFQCIDRQGFTHGNGMAMRMCRLLLPLKPEKMIALKIRSSLQLSMRIRILSFSPCMALAIRSYNNIRRVPQYFQLPFDHDPRSISLFTLTTLMPLCKPPHPLAALVFPQGRHPHHKLDIWRPRYDPKPVRQCGDVLKHSSHLSITNVSRA